MSWRQELELFLAYNSEIHQSDNKLNRPSKTITMRGTIVIDICTRSLQSTKQWWGLHFPQKNNNKIHILRVTVMLEQYLYSNCFDRTTMSWAVFKYATNRVTG